MGTIASLLSCNVRTTSEETERKFETDGMELAVRQEFLMTRDLKLNTVPKERLEAAREKMQGIARTARMEALAWQERGPNNIGGRTRAIIVDRRDASGNTVLAASVSGGIFKTTNFLNNPPSWKPVNDKLLNLAVTAMRQDKNNPAIMYAGTGEGWFNVDAVKGAGIFKSTDGGDTWNLLSSTSGYEYVQDIEIDNNGNVYAALRNLNSDNRGVVRSTDGGNSWTQVLGLPLAGFGTGRAADLEVASNGDVYATLGVFTRTQVMRSIFSLHGANTGGPGTWEEITPVHSNITQRGELAIAPSNPQRLYLMMQDSTDSQVKYIYKSNNSGTTWDSLPAPSALNNGTNSQTWFNLIAAVDPSNPDALYVGGLHLAKSTDGGSNWTNLASSTINIHVDQHELVYLSSNRLYVGNDGGVYYTGNATESLPNFEDKNTSYRVTQFYAVDFHPTTPNYFLAGAQDNNTQRFTTAGLNVTNPVVGGDGGYPHIDQTNGNLQIAATTGNNYFRSTNGGTSFSYISSVSNNRGQFINPTDYDDVKNVLYCGDDAGKYYVITDMETTPQGFTAPVSIMGNREVTAIRWDHLGNNNIWIGASLGNGVPMVIKLGNANTATPQVLTSATLGAPANAYISSIDVDPGNFNHILATISNYGVASVFESTDGGNTWNNIEGNLPDMPVNWGMFVQNNASVNGTTGGGILLGTELGVWYASQTSGSSTNWVPENTNLPNVRVSMLKYRASDNLLLASTHGRGLYSATLTAVNTGINPVADTKDFIKYINANQQELLIKVGNLTTTKMQIDIFDIKGRKVSSTNTQYADQRINVSALARGAYVLKIYGNKQEQYTERFIK